MIKAEQTVTVVGIRIRFINGQEHAVFVAKSLVNLNIEKKILYKFLQFFFAKK